MALRHAGLARRRPRQSGLLELACDEVLDLGNEQHVDALPLGDAAHAERALREVAEDHVLAERESGDCRVVMLDVHARRVDLCYKNSCIIFSNSKGSFNNNA